jgi:adenine-specific DNA-methyltransferase
MKITERKTEDNQISQLENEVARLNKKIAKYEAIELKQNRFGLVWLDVPEAFEDDVENKLPILEEIPKLAIKSDDEKPTHLLIEGDNYHALTCLNYTHKGKVDVIYIDPPYNTGSDGFKYKDKRILDKYPDGTEVPLDHPLRHSYWLSFMKKRLEIAKYLLRDTGIIFISIDDNEHAQLKLLCDEIFNENNFDGTITWEKRTKAQNTETAKEMLQSKTEYILVYKNNPNKVKYNLEVIGEKNYDLEDERGLYRLKLVEEMSALGMRGRHTMFFDIEGIKPRKGFQWKVGEDQVNKFKARKDIEIIDDRVFFKMRPSDENSKKFLPFWSHFFDKDTYGTSEKGKTELTKVLGSNDHEFETVKPVNLVKKLLFHPTVKHLTQRGDTVTPYETREISTPLRP